MATIDPTLLSHNLERAQVRPSVHNAAGVRKLGTTAEVLSLLESNRKAVFTLRDVLHNIRDDASPAEVNSVLSKLVKCQKARLSRKHNGVRMVNAYQWRSDASQAG